MKKLREIIKESDETIISHYTDKLSSNIKNPEEFSKIHDQLAKDPNVTQEHLDQIGKNVTYYPNFHKLGSKSKKLQYLKQAHEDSVEIERKGKSIDQLTPWQ